MISSNSVNKKTKYKLGISIKICRFFYPLSKQKIEYLADRCIEKHMLYVGKQGCQKPKR